MDSIFHRLFLASLSQIVSVSFVTFVFQWWRVRSARSCLYISESNVSVHPRRTLCAVGVQRLVGSHFHWLFLASLSEIVPAGFVTFVFQWWRVRCARSSPLLFDPTSAFTGGAPCAPYGATPCSTLCFFRIFMPGGRENRKNGLKIAFLGS